MNAARPAAALAGATLLLLSSDRAAAAQEVGAAVWPDTVTVGDVFHAAIRVQLAPGQQVELPDSLPVYGHLENAGAAERRSERLSGGRTRVTATYPLVAWRPGPAAIPAVPVRVRGPTGIRDLEATPGALAVRSVLPADTSGIQPRPAKDVIGPNWVVWPFLLLLLGLGLLIGGLAYWRRRRRGPPQPLQPVLPFVPPREAALAALDRAREAGLLEAGEFKRFYSLLSEALRHYLAALEPEWGADLTTTELRGRMRQVAGPEHDDGVTELARILVAADLVKFARQGTDAAQALAQWHEARNWVGRFRWVPAEGMSGRHAVPLPAGASEGVREAEVA